MKDDIEVLELDFENGVYFDCLMCGECCRGFDEGEIYLYKDDIIRLVKFLNKKGKRFTLQTFTKKYLKLITDEFYWKGRIYRFKSLSFSFTGNDAHCHFLEGNKCTVHEAKPFQCSSFPVGWNIISQSSRILSTCNALKEPSENKGIFYSKKEVLKWRKKEYNIEKQFFLKMIKNNFDIFKVYKFIPKDIT